MRVKLYRAANVGEAMAQARHELGNDALILGTRRVAGGMEVTAALEVLEDPAPPCRIPVRNPLPSRNLGVGSDRARLLSFHGVPPGLADDLAEGTLAEALARVLFFGAVRLDAKAPPLLLTGPAGGGKTSTVARLATRLVLGGSTPLIVTTDKRRAGATEQLAAFTRLLGLTLTVAHHPVTLARVVSRRPPGTPVLIDTASLDPFDSAERDALATLAQAAGAAVALALPAGLDPAEAADLGAAFADAGAGLLVATRLDQARRLGGILTAAQSGALPLAEAGIAPGAAAEGLVPLTPVLLARRLLGAGPNPPELHP